MKPPEWRPHADADALVQSLAEALCRHAERAVSAHGVFHLVLAGGATPRALYAELARRAAGDPAWHIWYGDERCLPADHAERNSVMAETAWLAASRIPPRNRHPIPAELGPEPAAAHYGEALRGIGEFDLVLLGLGEDGHTASLFPAHDIGAAPGSPDVLAVDDAPKPPAARVSLSAARLGRAGRVWFLVAGAGKRAAIVRWLRGEPLPAAHVCGREETVVWLDAAAWPDRPPPVF
ncbi:MAG: 6-phosphogluconolactonase [Betaproteobacteria bacterium]|nr:6-phosphogluconolactonase [Betaproteobacteria bacterium]